MKAQLEITRRLLGSSAIVSQEPGARDIKVKLDAEGFIRRLLLFDNYILYSVRLKEIPELVRHFGYEGTLALLSSGALEIRCECAQFVEGQFSTPACPPLTFQFHVIEAHIRDQYVIDNLAEVNRAPLLSSRELMALRSAVMRAVRQPDNREMFRSGVAPAFENDVLHNIPLLKAAVRFVLAKDKGVTTIDKFELCFHKVGDDRYKAETNLPKILALSIEDIHEGHRVLIGKESDPFDRRYLRHLRVAQRELDGFTGFDRSGCFCRTPESIVTPALEMVWKESWSPATSTTMKPRSESKPTWV
jgi:hypothetical protein